MAAEINVSYSHPIKDKPVVKSSKQGYEIFRAFYNQDIIELQEQFYVMYLNKANKVLGIYPHSVGGLSGTLADVRIILSIALRVAAAHIMISHNHPSGNLKPSKQDIELTQRIKQAGQIMDITLLDHIIVVPDDSEYYSFADEGII